MRQIWRIYTTDIRNVAKHWAAIVIILGLTILPSLYAWFNIEASWDPYGNTKDVPIAVSNEDTGTTLRGKDINIGKEVVDSLKKDKNLGWKFVDEKQAIDGVKHGDYYASITIPKDFSEKIATVLSDNPQKPELQYYVNEKVNAIAPKITSSGASGVVQEIGKNFVKTANGEIFKIFNELGIDLETNLPSIEKVTELVFKLEAQFPEINNLVDTALTDADTAQKLVKTAQATLPTVENVIRDGQEMTKDLDAFFAQNTKTLEAAPEAIKNNLTFLKQSADGAVQITEFLKNPAGNLDLANINEQTLTESSKTVKSFLASTRQVLVSTQQLADALKQNNVSDPEKTKQDLQIIKNQIDFRSKQVDSIISLLQTLNETFNTTIFNDNIDRLKGLKTVLDNTSKKIDNMIKAIDQGQQPSQDAINALDQAAKDGIAIIDSILGTWPDLDQLKQPGVNLDPAKNGLNSLKASLTTGIQLIDGIIPVLNDVDKIAGDLNKTTNIPNTINQLNKVKGDFQKGINGANLALDAMNKGQKPAKDVVDGINAASKSASAALGDILGKYDSEIVPSFNDAIERTKQMSKDTSKILSEANKSLPDVKKVLEDASKGLTLGKDEVEKIKAELPDAQKKITDIANKIRDFKSQEDLNDIIRLLKHDVEKQSDFFANPVNLKENKLYPIPNYGSAMSPFYTVLALWVGALLMVSLLTVEVHEEDAEYRSYHIYFGRFLTFLTVGLAQAFIVAMGDMFLLGTYVVDKFWFVLFSMLISGVFVCIVYSLVSVFGNVGKSFAVILLVLQVAGSGGTFPIQMTPKFFQALYPFLPFTYAISLIRETVGGMLWDIVWKDLLALCIWVVVMLVMALFLKKPINKSSSKFVENAKGSKLIH
ncbi:YhgE/Pip family protein [Bacillus sp. GB_SG_008]|uniref:YhgE/Pip family protein n=1 Tax=Bacillus sp. GB_SG_008 TaxID=3454627 RepID=UPI003F831B3A